MTETRLETERLVLRPMTSGDAESITQYIGNYEVSKTLAVVPHPYTLADAHEFLARQTDGDGPLVDRILGIQIKALSPHSVGAVGIHPGRAQVENEAEIGYWLGQPFWGKGYVSEAVQAVINFAFQELRYSRLTAGHFEGNVASRKILSKHGFEKTGSQMKHAHARGKDVLSHEMSLPRSVWKTAQK